MNAVLIRESKVLSILGFHFDSRLTLSYLIDSSVRCCRQRLGCLRQISKYLGTKDLILGYQVFMRPVAKYGSVLMIGASATQLSNLDCVQHFAKQLCFMQFSCKQLCFMLNSCVSLLNSCVSLLNSCVSCKCDMSWTFAEVLSIISVLYFPATEIPTFEHFTTIFVDVFHYNYPLRLVL